eukprot:bmy_12501T0
MSRGLDLQLTDSYFQRISSYTQTSWIIKTIKYYCRITISILFKWESHFYRIVSHMLSVEMENIPLKDQFLGSLVRPPLGTWVSPDESCHQGGAQSKHLSSSIFQRAARVQIRAATAFLLNPVLPQKLACSLHWSPPSPPFTERRQQEEVAGILGRMREVCFSLEDSGLLVLLAWHYSRVMALTLLPWTVVASFPGGSLSARQRQELVQEAGLLGLNSVFHLKNKRESASASKLVPFIDLRELVFHYFFNDFLHCVFCFLKLKLRIRCSKIQLMFINMRLFFLILETRSARPHLPLPPALASQLAARKVAKKTKFHFFEASFCQCSKECFHLTLCNTSWKMWVYIHYDSVPNLTDQLFSMAVTLQKAEVLRLVRDEAETQAQLPLSIPLLLVRRPRETVGPGVTS